MRSNTGFYSLKESKESIIQSYIDSCDEDKLLSYISSLTSREIKTIRMSHNNQSIITRLVIMDLFPLFSSSITLIKHKLNQIELYALINSTDLEGNTALHYASFRGNYKIVKLLIEIGSNVYTRNRMGLTVLHMAAQGDRANLIMFYKIKYNFDIYDSDYSGNSPLHWACYTCAENSITFLLKFMDNVNIIDKKGQTPLHIAIYTFSSKLIKKLISKGADLYKKDAMDQSVYSIVIENKKHIPDFENVLKVITDSQPIKFKNCIYGINHNNSNHQNIMKNKSIFNSKFFILIHIICFCTLFYLQVAYYLSKKLLLFFTVIVINLMISFFICHKNDPGYIVNKDNLSWLELIEKIGDINRYCPYCKIEKTKKVKHCHICNKCVKGFDHHCNWIDNCVGENNYKIFIYFVFSVIINLVVCYFISLIIFIMPNKKYRRGHNREYIGFSLLLKLSSKDVFSVLIMSICLFFLIPVIFVLMNQINIRIKNRDEQFKYINREEEI